MIKIEQRLFIDQNVAPPSAIFQCFDFIDQRAIMGKESAFGEKLTLYQRAANKQLTGLLQGDWPVMHSAPCHDRQAKQCDLFKGHHLCALHFPMRLAVAALH